jgi:hypothetical protein
MKLEYMEEAAQMDQAIQKELRSAKCVRIA